MTELKERLSHLDRNSWHAKLVINTYGKDFVEYKPLKACPYWWLLVPSSPIVAGAKLLLFVVARLLSIAVYAVSQVVLFFFGVMLLETPFTYGHKIGVMIGEQYTPTPRFNTKKFAPQWIVSAWIAAGLVIGMSGKASWFADHRYYFIYIGSAVAGLAALGGIYGKWLHGPVSRWYAKNCPPIEWKSDA